MTAFMKSTQKCEFVLKNSICHKEYHADTDALESTRHELSSHCIHNSPTAADPNLQSRLLSQMSILKKEASPGSPKVHRIGRAGSGFIFMHITLYAITVYAMRVLIKGEISAVHYKRLLVSPHQVLYGKTSSCVQFGILIKP